MTFTLLHIGSRLFKLFSKDIRVKKQPGMPLNSTPVKDMTSGEGHDILLSHGKQTV